MIGIIITGHGQFATGLLSSLQLIAGSFENVAAVDFDMNECPETLTKKLQETIQNFNNCDEILFFTDVLGGSPFKCSVMVSQAQTESRVVAGANLPMLLEIIFLRETGSIEELKNAALEAGKNGIKCFSDEVRVKKQSTLVGI